MSIEEQPGRGAGGRARTSIPLQLPTPARVRYARNTIRQVVCEIRFPTLLELETETPVQIQKALRKEYPGYSKELSVQFSPTNEPQSISRHMFTSRDNRWRFALRASAFSLETTSYDRFEELAGRIDTILSRVAPHLDTDFFTRVGLRYINILPTNSPDCTGWVNPSLLAPIATGAWGEPSHFFQEIRGLTATAHYSFRHGLAQQDGSDVHGYMLDSDVYSEATELSETMSRLADFHKANYSIFSWSLGPLAKEYLGGSTEPNEGKS